ncbi:MAG: hypothetical protein ABIS14_03355 [Sphingomonas sp.]
MIGLAAVLLLIGLAAAVFSTASRERPVRVVGGARPEVVANLVAVNQSAPAANPTNEPLAELGVAPGAQNDPTANTAAARTTQPSK